MLEQDYLVRLLVDLAAAIRRSLQKARGEKDFDTANKTLENSITQASDLDGSVLLSLSPESVASVLKISNTDPRAVVYIAHSMQLQSYYLKKLEREELSKLRYKQAFALADAYGFELPDDIEDFDSDQFNCDDYIDSIETATQFAT